MSQVRGPGNTTAGKNGPGQVSADQEGLSWRETDLARLRRSKMDWDGPGWLNLIRVKMN